LITIATNSCERLPRVYLYVLTMGHREPRVGSNTYAKARRTRNAGPGNPDDVGAAHLGSARDRHARSRSRVSSHGWTLLGWTKMDGPRPFSRLSPEPFCKTRGRQEGDECRPASRGERNGVLPSRERHRHAWIEIERRATASSGERDANLTATEEHAARAAPLRAAGHVSIRVAARHGATHAPIGSSESRGLARVSSNLPRSTRPVARCIGGRAIEGHGGGGARVTAPRSANAFPRVRPLCAVRVAARVRNLATTRGCARAHTRRPTCQEFTRGGCRRSVRRARGERGGAQRALDESARAERKGDGGAAIGDANIMRK